ncbi:hypothetical protein PFNF54_02527 [Plasmodium falciparum NF54]|uniref:Uncharacterized protein n=1 Tax=Plasmodium falciparum (isolate NF54) TaxID=5843 RepID=W7JUP5_PLAFO|nr:hypothetical protein PFNF54_02527 [Plasmodium falciparum NF54]
MNSLRINKSKYFYKPKIYILYNMYIILLNCLIKSIPLNMIYIYIYYIYFKLYKNIFVYNIMFVFIMKHDWVNDKNYLKNIRGILRRSHEEWNISTLNF